MSTKLGQQLLDEATRDKAFAQLKTIGQNNICIDCEKKHPKWASIHLGIYLCIDCAGRHRQYGVAVSFVKSINLDSWNQKQVLYMQKGGNTRAFEHFRKRGIITPTNKAIDYKSSVVRQYKELLTQEVELELAGGKKAKPQEVQKKSAVNDFFQQIDKKQQEKKVEIAKAEIVEQQNDKPKKKKEKKKIGAKQINFDDFENHVFDDGVSFEEKNKIIKEYEKNKDLVQINQPIVTSGSSADPEAPKTPKIEEPKELNEQDVKKKLEELKLQKNVKNISSDSFKDTSIDNVTLKQNLNKFSGSTSISSSAFFNKEQPENPNQVAIENIKDMVSNVGAMSQNLFSKISTFWKK